MRAVAKDTTHLVDLPTKVLLKNIISKPVLMKIQKTGYLVKIDRRYDIPDKVFKA